MQRFLWFLLLLCSPILAFGQNLELLSPLSNSLQESSGLILLNGKLITHLDSGADATLYELDSLSGNVLRSVVVNGVGNTDWEDITHDEEYIYIGDFGNNNGTRTDLKVIRISQSDYFETDNDEVEAEVISFNYSDQTDFTSSTFTTNYDAEALISFGDSLYIFTKNWGNMITTIYPLSKNPGNYSLIKTDSIDVQGLITGASVNLSSNEVILSGYTFVAPFAVKLSGFENSIFSSGSVEILDLTAPSGYSYQIEGVTLIEPELYYFTSESSFAGDAGLFELQFTPTGRLEVYNEPFNLFPNPTTGPLNISGEGIAQVYIYDNNGKTVLESKQLKLDVSGLPCGMYMVELRNSELQIIGKQKLIIR